MNKIWIFFKKWWKVILVVPAVLIALGTAVIFFSNLLKRFLRLISHDEELQSIERMYEVDMHKIDSKEDAAVEKIRTDGEKTKDRIESGDPSPANVFNATIKGEPISETTVNNKVDGTTKKS